jgi:hypothetical protein
MRDSGRLGSYGMPSSRRAGMLKIPAAGRDLEVLTDVVTRRRSRPAAGTYLVAVIEPRWDS